MSAASLEYSMFRFSDDYPTSDIVSDMIMQVAMKDCCDEHDTNLLRHLVEAAWCLRATEAPNADLDDGVPVEAEPDTSFIEKYRVACRRIGEPFDRGDVWWEDWWPTRCPWHPGDIARLARLKAGESHAVRRSLLAAFAREKGGE